MQFEGQFYYDKCLPQGGASSYRSFETFSTAVQAIFQYYHPQANCVRMIDDFLVLADSQRMCQKHLTALLDLCKDIGIPMAPEKTTQPSTTTTFLCIELDTISQTAKLPLDKLQNYLAAITLHKQGNTITRHYLESLIGRLNFASSVVPARPFLRRLIDLFHPSQKPHHYIKLTAEVKEDLSTWK